MEHKLISKWGCLQLVLVTLVLFSLTLSVGTIIFLLEVKNTAQVVLEQAATDLTTLSESSIKYTIHLSQTVPIQAEVILNEKFSVPIDIVISQTIPINTNIPFQLPFSAGPINIPISVDVPINMPIQTEVVVPINRTVPISVELPLVLDVPMEIAINKTLLKDYLLNLAEILRNISKK